MTHSTSLPPQVLLPEGVYVDKLNVILGYIVFVTVPIFFTYFMLNFFVAQVSFNQSVFILTSHDRGCVHIVIH